MLYAEDDEVIELERMRDDDPVVRVIPDPMRHPSSSNNNGSVADASPAATSNDPWQWWGLPSSDAATTGGPSPSTIDACWEDPDGAPVCNDAVTDGGTSRPPHLRRWLQCAVDGLATAARRTATTLCRRSASAYPRSPVDDDATLQAAVNGASWLHRLMHSLSLENCVHAWRTICTAAPPPPVLLLSWHGNDKQPDGGGNHLPCRRSREGLLSCGDDDGEEMLPRAKKYRWEGCETPWQNRCHQQPPSSPAQRRDVAHDGDANANDGFNVDPLREDATTSTADVDAPPSKLRVSEAFYRRAQGSCWSAGRRVASPSACGAAAMHSSPLLPPSCNGSDNGFPSRTKRLRV